MDRDEWMPLVLMFVMMVALFVSSYLPNPWNYVLMFGTYGMFVGYTILSQEMTKYKISAFKALDAIIVPEMKRETFLIKSHETVHVGNNTYLSVLHLFNVYKDPEGGRTKTIYLSHYLPLNQRLQFKPGKVRYSGMVLPHRGVEVVILARDQAGYVFRGKLYPVFYLHSCTTDAERYLAEYSKVWTDAKRV